jgi:NTP pyrophosphatase (non-canonical NTP hydrolase)
VSDQHETQASINAWQRETFPDATTYGTVQHVLEEANEWLKSSTDAEAAVEAADIMISLYHWCDRVGVDLHAEIDAKMARNRARTWRIQPDGTGRHT